MTRSEQQRSMVLTKLLVGGLTSAEAAGLLAVSSRTIRRLRRRLEQDGPGGLVHGNRGRASPRRLSDATRARILELARTRYEGANDSHLAELLAEAEGIRISRPSLQRLLRGAGIASPRRRRAPRHRSRRDRMPQAGLLLQTDGSRFDWLGPARAAPHPRGRHRHRHRGRFPRRSLPSTPMPSAEVLLPMTP